MVNPERPVGEDHTPLNPEAIMSNTIDTPRLNELADTLEKSIENLVVAVEQLTIQMRLFSKHVQKPRKS